MPFCQISDDVSLHYITNTPSGEITDFGSTKATILLIPPLFCDVTWLREQFKDPRLSNEYNLIAFDQRNMGRTKSPPSPKRDTLVDAADIALAQELLQLPPCHIFAVAMNACGAALRFAILFPEKCLSLCLCGVPNQAGDDPEWVPQGYVDLIESWCNPVDIDMLECANMEMLWFMFNGQVTPELEDEMVAWWQMNLPPTNRCNFYAQGLCGVLRHPYTDKELNSIKQPTLILQGDKSLNNPPHKAQETSTKIPNSRLFVVNGSASFGPLVPDYASVINRIYCQFLGELPPHPAFRPSQPDPEGVLRRGLDRLAFFAEDPSIARRDPTTPLSFCQFSAELIERNAKEFARHAEGEKEALSPLNEHGQPLRKISERNADEWSPPAFERMKQSEVTVLKTETVSVT